MQHAGINNMCCSSREDWIRILSKVIEDEKTRILSGEMGHAYVEREYSSEQLLNKWDEIFVSVLG